MVDNITLTIGNTSQAIYDCALMTELKMINLTSYAKKFTSWNNYFLAFIMNLSGNTVNFFNFFFDINSATQTCNLNVIYTTFGKIALAMMKVQPTQGSLR